LPARKWNPQTGKVPVIEIDGERVHDSCDHRAATRRDRAKPAAFVVRPVVAAQQRLLEDWSDEALC
jgi:hypothetical protein